MSNSTGAASASLETTSITTNHTSALWSIKQNKNKNKTKQRLSLVGTRYTSIETDRKFELFAGLLYSLYEVSENEKFPFLRPQFAHVIREVHDDVPLSWDSYEKYDPLPILPPYLSSPLLSSHLISSHLFSSPLISSHLLSSYRNPSYSSTHVVRLRKMLLDLRRTALTS